MDLKMPKMAKLLDTSVIGHSIILDDIISDKHYDYFITRKILGEIVNWEKKGPRSIKNKLESLNNKVNTVQSKINDPTYESISKIVNIYDKRNGLTSNPIIPRMVHLSEKKGIIFDFSTNSTFIKNYIKFISKNYLELFSSLKLDCKLYENELVIKPSYLEQSEKPTKIVIKNIKKLKQEFKPYELILNHLEVEKSYTLTQEIIMGEGMKILDYFKENPGRVIDHKTDENILKFSSLTAKSLAKNVAQRYYNGKIQNWNQIPCFLKYVNEELEFKLNDIGITNKRLVLASIHQVQLHLEYQLKKNNGYIPSNKVSDDINLVSAACHFGKEMPDYKLAHIYTRDSDIATVSKICQIKELNRHNRFTYSIKPQIKHSTQIHSN